MPRSPDNTLRGWEVRTERRVTWTDPRAPEINYEIKNPSKGDLLWLRTERPNTENIRIESRSVTYGDWVKEEES